MTKSCSSGQSKKVKSEIELIKLFSQDNPELLSEYGFNENGCFHLHKKKFCGKPFFGEDCFCFWHSKIEHKSSPENCSLAFGDSQDFCSILVEEISRNRDWAGYYFKGEDFSSFANKISFSNVNFSSANLEKTNFSNCNVSGSNFSMANLKDSVLSYADIRGCDFSHAKLFNIQFCMNSFQGVEGITKDSFRGYGSNSSEIFRIAPYVPEGLSFVEWNNLTYQRIMRNLPRNPQHIFKLLISYFSQKGLLDDASWAAYEERCLKHQLLREDLRMFLDYEQKFELIGHNSDSDDFWCKKFLENSDATRCQFWPFYKEVFKQLFRIALSGFFKYTTGYGEKPHRALLCSGLIIFSYSFLYYIFDCLTKNSFHNSLYFSIVTFTTLGYGDIAPAENFRLLAASEAFLGLIFSGLFLFSLGRRSIGRG